jgi:hypothetical protein
MYFEPGGSAMGRGMAGVERRPAAGDRVDPVVVEPCERVAPVSAERAPLHVALIRLLL